MRAAAVYRLYACDGTLLYVGVTYDFDKRFKEHAKKRWWPNVAHKDVVWFMDRSDALYEEARAIDDEAPAYNSRPGIGPLGAKVLWRRYDNLPWGCPPPVGVYLVDKWRVGEALDEAGRGNAVVEVAFEGHPMGIAVPLDWYKAACRKLGRPVDFATMPAIETDVLL